MRTRAMLQGVAVVVSLLCASVLMAADGQSAVGPSADAQFAAIPNPLPVLLSAQYEALEPTKDVSDPGGCVAGLISGCVSTPFGQWENSGYKPSVGRSVARVLMVGRLYDMYKAYQGETTEEYLGIDSLSEVEPTEEQGGFEAGIKACCLEGVPAGQLKNSGISVPTRSWLRLLPYVNTLVWAYDGVKAYQGETIEEYAGQDAY